LKPFAFLFAALSALTGFAAPSHNGPIASVVVSPHFDTLTPPTTIGSSAMATCAPKNSNNVTVQILRCRWVSRNTAVVTVASQPGNTAKITARGTGQAYVVATVSDKKDSVRVTVLNPSVSPVLTGLVVTPALDTLEGGDTLRFTATPTWSDGSSAARIATWRATGGTISRSGLYTAGGTAGTFRVIGYKGPFGDTSVVVISPAE
jgi:hypothetical protein